MDAEKKNKVISPVDILTKKYKDRLNDLIVMDDYDGGQASVLREVVTDLEMINKTEKLLVE